MKKAFQWRVRFVKYNRYMVILFFRCLKGLDFKEFFVPIYLLLSW